MNPTQVVRPYLHMTAASQIKPAKLVDECIRVAHLAECPPSFWRFLYREVGHQFHWLDRLGWTDEQIANYLGQAEISLWVLYCEGVPAGYFELRNHQDRSVEIAYFGLLKEFRGRGLGKHLLNIAVEAAWNRGANRVWVHTCTLDHPAALPNYLHRGFQPFRQETYSVRINS